MKIHNRKSYRWLIYLALGLLLAGIAAHPYFRLSFWPEDVIEEYATEGNYDFFYSATQFRLLPKQTRMNALAALGNWATREHLSNYLTPETVSSLEREHPELGVRFFDHISPSYPAGNINPRLFRVIVDRNQDRNHRIFTFLQLVESQTLSESKLEQLRALWIEIDDEEVKKRIATIIERYQAGGIADDNIRVSTWKS